MGFINENDQFSIRLWEKPPIEVRYLGQKFQHWLIVMDCDEKIGDLINIKDIRKEIIKKVIDFFSISHNMIDMEHIRVFESVNFKGDDLVLNRFFVFILKSGDIFIVNEKKPQISDYRVR